MSTVFGPRDEEGETGWSGRVAAQWLAAVVSGISRLKNGDVRARFAPNTLRLAFHGESEYSGNGFVRGGNLMLMIGMSIFVPFYLSMVCLGVMVNAPTLVGMVVSAIGVALALFGTIVGVGTADIYGQIEVVDHTVPEQPAELDELQERFVDGDLDRRELESEVERVIDR